MTEFFRGLVLPDVVSPKPVDLISLLLVWDQLEVQAYPEDDNQFRSELRSAGLITEFPGPLEFEIVVDESGAPDSERAEYNGETLANGIIVSVQDSLEEARAKGFAPVATTPFAELAASLPAATAAAPVAEASLLQVATQGIQVAPDTTVEDLLAFRDKNKRSMGRFRGAMADLAQAIATDTSGNPAEEARAVIKNRVEPTIGDLTEALDRNRISFAMKILFGAVSASLTAGDPASTSLPGGLIASRSLRYAFDRERLINDHPFGLIYRARREFPLRAEQCDPVITDPAAAIRDRCIRTWQGVFDDLRQMSSKPSTNPG